jgi:hypothetical protein
VEGTLENLTSSFKDFRGTRPTTLNRTRESMPQRLSTIHVAVFHPPVMVLGMLSGGVISVKVMASGGRMKSVC